MTVGRQTVAPAIPGVVVDVTSRSLCQPCWNRGRNLWVGDCICTGDIPSNAEFHAAFFPLREKVEIQEKPKEIELKPKGKRK